MRKRVAVVLTAVLLLVVTLHGSAPRQTLASWADSEKGTGSFTAGAVGAPTGLHCTGNNSFAWTAPVGSAPVTGYYWTLTPNGLFTPSGSGTIAGTSITVSIGLLSIGSSTFEVQTVGTGSWVSNPALNPTGTINSISIFVSCSVP